MEMVQLSSIRKSNYIIYTTQSMIKDILVPTATNRTTVSASPYNIGNFCPYSTYYVKYLLAAAGWLQVTRIFTKYRKLPVDFLETTYKIIEKRR